MGEEGGKEWVTRQSDQGAAPGDSRVAASRLAALLPISSSLVCVVMSLVTKGLVTKLCGGALSTASGPWKVQCELLLGRTFWKLAVPGPASMAAAEPLPGS